METYISLSEWSKAETLLLSARPPTLLSLYQLSQVLLNQDRLAEALGAVEEARGRCGRCGDLRGGGGQEGGEERCSGICVRVLAQEGDILQECGRYKLAAEVRRKGLELESIYFCK